MIYFALNNYFSTELSPRRLGILSRRFLSGQNQKNQDWLMQRCNAAPTSHNPVRAMLLFIITRSMPFFLILRSRNLINLFK